MIRAFLFYLLFASLSRGETLDEAARELARRVNARLAPAEAPRVTARNLSPLGTSEVAKARATLERAIRRPVARPAQPVDLIFTVSQNLHGFLLIAELQRNNERMADMVEYRPAPVARSTRAALEKRLLWEQDAPMLDLAIAGDKMIVLEPDAIAIYARHSPGWEFVESKALQQAAAVRDPRGRLVFAESSVSIFLEGTVCRGSWTPALDLNCESGDVGFAQAGEQLRFTTARNTLEAAGWPPFFSYARLDEQSRPLYLVAELDGRTHVYDADKHLAWSFAAWGSDFVTPDSGCASGRQVLATGATDRDSGDSLTAFEFVDRKPAQVSDPAEFPGPIVALWPTANGALAIAHNLATGRYAAYSITIDCAY